MALKLLFVVACLVAMVHGHGYMREPIARTSIQLRPEFNTQQPYWWDNTGVWCGNVQQNQQYSRCGRCGDAPGESTANQNGIYDKKVIVATYQSGSTITVESEFSAAHYGHVELELCAQETETDGCFQKLRIVSSTEEVRDSNRFCVSSGGSLPLVRTQAQLPAGVRCNRCTLRWTYRTSYTPHGPQYGRDFCDNPGDTQTFRNCADVKIV